MRLRLRIASVPGSPAGGRDRACLPLDLVVRCSSAGGVEFRVLASWGPLLVPGSLYSPATEILSFFLGSFEVVDEGILPPTADRSFIGGTSACSGPLLRVTAISGLRAADCGLPLQRWVHARVWMVACLSLLREWRMATSRVPLMLCASTGICFRSILASSRLSFVWDFGGLVQVFSCLTLSVPVGVRSVFSPADFSSPWLCLVGRT